MDLKILMKVDQNGNTYRISVGGRKTHQNKNDDRKYRRRVCLSHAHRDQLTSQRAIRCQTFEREQSKTQQNGSVDANRSMRC